MYYWILLHTLYTEFKYCPANIVDFRWEYNNFKDAIPAKDQNINLLIEKICVIEMRSVHPQGTALSAKKCAPKKVKMKPKETRNRNSHATIGKN